MKPSELRIGNFVEDRFDLKNIVIRQIDLDDFVVMSNYQNSNQPNYYHPIKLSKEWLSKLGFENSFPVLLTNSDGDQFYLADTKIEFVHQLQNFYQAINGVELQVVSD